MSIRCIFAFLHFYSIHEGAVNLHVQKSTILYMQLACYLYIKKKKKTFYIKKFMHIQLVFTIFLI